jgi:ABC-2 type transport system ATP-binding protein
LNDAPATVATPAPSTPDPGRGPGSSDEQPVAGARIPTIRVSDLVKVYPGGTRAVDGITFDVGAGEFFGFLGPNGAGKTTTIRILATLLQPTSGLAAVAGHDVLAEPAAVRRSVGFAMQTVAIDQFSTGRENLELIGHLHRVPGAELRRRVDELLELMNLTAAARKLAGTYSGGMKRRLDLATALIHQPAVLFLDEPTEGLDPQSRTALWEELERINRAGTTMFLTTHYMEEADRLCNRVAIVDEGKIVVEGRPADLKRAIGADVVSLAMSTDGDAARLTHAQAEVERLLAGFEPVVRLERSPDGMTVYVQNAAAAIPELVRRLDGDGVALAALTMTQPSLDDVFLRHTGKRIRSEDASQAIPLGWWS